MRALESVREHVARLSTEGSLERELGDPGLRTRLRAIRDEAARSELAEIKQQLLPEAAAAAAPAAQRQVPVAAV